MSFDYALVLYVSSIVLPAGLPAVHTLFSVSLFCSFVRPAEDALYYMIVPSSRTLLQCAHACIRSIDRDPRDVFAPRMASAPPLFIFKEKKRTFASPSRQSYSPGTEPTPKQTARAKGCASGRGAG